MAKPRVFISSTFYDLKHIRSSVENFIQSLGFDSILSEKGNIAYNPDKPLDDSCYHEINNSDILVLIVGGRYGSPSSDQPKDLPKSFYTRYQSITKKEYLTAIEKEIPTFILIEKSVYSEFETFRRNRNNDKVEYAHVDSVNIFHLIDEIIMQPRNNPIFQFENHNEIEEWLREQWAGLFRDLIYSRKEIKHISSLTSQVQALSNINTTLKRYLEEIISRVSGENAEQVISQEDKRIEEFKKMQKFMQFDLVFPLIDIYNFTQEEAYEVFTKAKTVKDLIKRIASRTEELDFETVYEKWKNDKESKLKQIDLIMDTLDREHLKFE